MKSTISQLLLALLLIGAGVILWSRAAGADRLAEAQRALVTLRYDRAAGELAVADYWAGRYDALPAERDAFLAANAAYRVATLDGGDWQAVTTRLDGVIRQYADVLRNNPGHADAAYNYEFAVRYRAAIAARRQPVPPAAAGEVQPTPHGFEGAPPELGDARQFKVIIPMRPDERQEAEEAGRNTRRVRKG